MRARAGPAGRMTAFYMLSIGPRPQPVVRRVARAALGLGVVLALAIAMTWPLAAGFGTYGRTRGVDADGMYAIWNVSWVAHALTSDPRQLFDANIFHPHRWALAFSELNIVAGIVGIPGWLLTRNPLVAHNSALLFAFCTSTIGAWLLARRLTGSDGAAIVDRRRVRLLSVFLFPHRPHPAVDGRRDSALAADAAPPRRRSRRPARARRSA